MPVYNGSQYLKEAILSVLQQTERDFEFIIVDDGSTDKTSEIVGLFAQQDKRIRYERRAHAGLVSTLNYGISIAQGKYVARMDADDIAMPERFNLQGVLLDMKPEIALCGTQAHQIDSTGSIIGKFTRPLEGSKEIRSYALLHNPFIHPTVMIRRSVFDRVGGYRSFWKHIEDYELWTRILPYYQAANIIQPLIKYRTHSMQVTKKKRFHMLVIGILVRLLYIWRLLISKVYGSSSQVS